MHAVTDENGRPIRFFISAGTPLTVCTQTAAGQRISDYTGAAALLSSLPSAQWLLADRGYDADWFREGLENKGIKSCIPGRKSRTKPVKYDKRRYKQRNRLLAHVNMRCQEHIERMFGRLKDWPIVGKTVPRTVF